MSTSDSGLALTGADTGAYPEERLEEEYRKIGWWKGPHAEKAAREAVRSFWKGLGTWGARWLARRLRRETHVDAVEGVANLLADLGAVAAGPVLEELEGTPSWDQAKALLTALRWLPSPGHLLTQDRQQRAIAKFAADADADLREAACRATRVLPQPEALLVLRQALSAEENEDVRQAIEAEIDDRELHPAPAAGEQRPVEGMPPRDPERPQDRIKLRAFDDRYIDANEEREILKHATRTGLGIDEARRALLSMCDSESYVLESEVLRKVEEFLRTAVRDRGVITRTAFDKAVEACAQRVEGKKTLLQCQRMVIEVIETHPWKVQAGWFSNWYRRVKREVGME
jgi:hypothetical protein